MFYNRVFFTQEESWNPRWSLQTAIDAATIVLKDMFPKKNVPLKLREDALKVKPSTVMMPLLDVNEITDIIVRESCEAAGLKPRLSRNPIKEQP